MGFRSGAQPVVAFITDNEMRDPDAGDESPGGCHIDAGQSDVVEAAAELGAKIISIQVGSHVDLTDPMTSLAEDSGSLGDVDGDGVYDEPLVYWVDASDVNEALIEAMGAIESYATTYEEVSLRPVDDEYGVVDTISPESYTEVDLAVAPSLAFDITLAGNIPGAEEAQTVELSFDLVGDGVVLDTRTITIEVPPAD